MVPHGTGIGDLVNDRPLLEAIASVHSGSELRALCDPGLGWLLPAPFRAVSWVHGVWPWRRMRSRGWLGRRLAGLGVAGAGHLMAPLTRPTTARWMAWYLRLQEYSLVISLLEMLSSQQGFPARWTPAPGDRPQPRHLVDLLAVSLSRVGIPVPEERRRPRLPSPPLPLDGLPAVLVNPRAGSSLKEAPLALWVEVVRGLDARGLQPWIVHPPGEQPEPDLLAASARARPLGVPFPRLARLIAGADLVIGPDTGVLHVAAATGAPYVGLFGATDPRFCGPYPGGAGEVVEAPFRHAGVCRHCWRAQLLPAASCPLFTPTTCLSTLAPEVVLAAVDRVRARAGRARS